MYKKFLIVLFLLSLCELLFAQNSAQTEKYRNEPLGNIQYRREGLMDGNLVRTLFYNNGEVGQWPYQPSGEWPKGSSHSYLDGVTVLIASELNTAAGKQHSLVTSYREWMDFDPVTGEIWGLEPVPGYSNPSNESPAISTNADTWPEIWSRALPNVDKNWDKLWYGYFGRGVKNSDLETFFVMDDSKDGEFSRAPYNFTSIASMPDRKGLGLRVEVRGFQWSHVLAEDIIFWHYDIVNISDLDHNNTYFGFYTDPGVGGTDDSQDDNASYDKKLDLTYAFDDDGKGVPGQYKTGYYGYAYLESPGNATNGKDDDDDGLVDERRDNLIDEDGDWLGYEDLNKNGKWDAAENEPLNDDLGKDGVGPFDPQYNGPDEGEGDGLPTDGEPHIDRTDKDESDQIGLTALSIYRLGQGGTGGGWAKDDESMWLKMSTAKFDTSLQRANISMVFASGAFPLKQHERERFSMALVFGDNFEDLVFNKETVQQIYNANYNFSKPPLKPTLTAVPGDGKVFLYWNDIAEESRDPFLGWQDPADHSKGYKKDFEGYLLYRSTEAEFNDIKVITDSKGNAKYWKPIAQFDLKNTIEGPDPIGINGARFWRGSNTGLQHSFIDSTVTNGKKYYYALVSYDQGDPAYGTKGLVPSECTKIITEDYSGVVKFVDINCAVITPNAPAAGYVSSSITGDVSKVASGLGTGSLKLEMLNPADVKDGASYDVVFNSTGLEHNYKTQSLSLRRTVGTQVDTLIKNLSATEFGRDKFSEPFDGMVFSVLNDTLVSVNQEETGWLQGACTSTMNVIPDQTSPAVSQTWPADYEIRFYDKTVFTTPNFKIPLNFLVFNTTKGDTVDFELFDNDKSKSLTFGDNIVIMEYIGKQFKLTWRIEYRIQPIGKPEIHPAAGDVFAIKTNKPFKSGDKFTFKTKAQSINPDLAISSLSDIKVVPNPYVAAAEWEARNLNQTGRGDRRIDFIHLPSECTVRIYTVSGSLVKTLRKENSISNGALSWNLISDDGMDVAYGLYIYHVDAPGIGEYIGKFAIVK